MLAEKSHSPLLEPIQTGIIVAHTIYFEPAVSHPSYCRFAVEVLNLNNPTVGRVVTTQSLDREDVANYQFNLIAEDRATNSLSTSVPFLISLLDQNDNDPTFDRPMWTFGLPENTNGTLIMDLNVSLFKLLRINY